MDVGLVEITGSEACGGAAALDSMDEIDMGWSARNASWIDGSDCRGRAGCSLSSSDVLRDSGGETSPFDTPTTELAVEDGYEYGGGGPEQMDGLMRGGAGILMLVVTGAFGL